jgi:hypothetical protein
MILEKFKKKGKEKLIMAYLNFVMSIFLFFFILQLALEKGFDQRNLLLEKQDLDIQN